MTQTGRYEPTTDEDRGWLALYYMYGQYRQLSPPERLRGKPHFDGAVALFCEVFGKNPALVKDSVRDWWNDSHGA